MTLEKKEFIRENVTLSFIADQFKKHYMEVILYYHTAISHHEEDLGQTESS